MEIRREVNREKEEGTSVKEESPSVTRKVGEGQRFKVGGAEKRELYSSRNMLRENWRGSKAFEGKG